MRYLFRFDPSTGILAVAEEEAESPPEWLGQNLATHAQTKRDSTDYTTLLIEPEDEQWRAFVYAIARSDEWAAPVGYGFEADLDELVGYFTRGLEAAPLLPATLTGGVSYDSLLSVRVRTADYTEFLDLTDRSAPSGGYGTAVASRPLQPRFGELSIEVSIDPAAAEMLVIGGLPSSRLPFILGLFLLTAGLIVAALLQFRREQELDRLRTEFVSNVSHELRTPLAQIRMFAETLLLGRVRSEEERTRSLAIMDKETRRLTHLVENVLLFSRSERGTMQLEPELVELEPLLEEVVESFRPLAESRKTSISVSSQAIAVNVDPGATRQIVLNLLDNAVKYGPSGQHVSVSAELVDGWAKIRVEDEGPGIPQADRSRVWERFGRLERDRKSPNAGTGIGLAVVHELARLHDGRAYVESGENGGARFVIELPGARRAHRETSEVAQPAETAIVQSTPVK